MKSNYEDSIIDRECSFKSEQLFFDIDRDTEDLQIAYYQDDPIKNEYLLDIIFKNRLPTIDHMVKTSYHDNMNIDRDELASELKMVIYKSIKNFSLEKGRNFNTFLFTNMINRTKNINLASHACKRTGVLTNKRFNQKEVLIHKNDKFVSLDEHLFNNGHETKIADIISDHNDEHEKMSRNLNVEQFIKKTIKDLKLEKHENILTSAFIKVSQGQSFRDVQSEITDKNELRVVNSFFRKLKERKRMYKRQLIGLE